MVTTKYLAKVVNWEMKWNDTRSYNELKKNLQKSFLHVRVRLSYKFQSQALVARTYHSPFFQLSSMVTTKYLAKVKSTIFTPAELHALWIISIYIGSTHAVWC
jgi:hypothetical protein